MMQCGCGEFAAGSFRPWSAPVRKCFAPLIIMVGLLASGASADPARIVMLGDSITAGYGLTEADSLPARLQAALKARGRDVVVENAGVSGDTSAGGLARLDWAVAGKPDVVIVELGANDGLRGLDPAATRANLSAIIRRLKEKGVAVMLAGMYAPPNLGPAYGNDFNALYPRLAREHDIAFYPFILEGVAARPELNQSDGIHPNARGVAAIVDRLVPHVLTLLERRR
jgi:acyl-CoA thioesterase-1